ncbi:MAG: NADH-quinone oxidoreductase subunit H [Deltaproteobacteria bacterium]|nr:NADH-quinone oxidoreductase subunit H [Deltaproteobacteria bacterium]
MHLEAFMNIFFGIVFAPLLAGIISRVKARVAGRTGKPLLQLYFDIYKNFRRGAVYSTTTSWLFRAGPIVGLAAALTALAIAPPLGSAAPLAFTGDVLLFAYMLGLMRFFTVLAALDTGSSFEGMGASREVFFSALAEPVLLLGLAAVARKAGTLQLSELLAAASATSPELVLVLAALCIVFLCENARIPFDDPNTHLELTMIHEVMVLDHSGPDFAFIECGAALKMWVLGSVIVGLVLPGAGENAWLVNGAAMLAGMFVLAISVGTVESVMARLRLLRVPQLLMTAGALSAFAFILVMR